jgi:hypothetical protein
VRPRVKGILLAICLFLFLFVVIGGGLHLTPAAAFLAATTGTPLAIHAFHQWAHRSEAQNAPGHTQIVPASRVAVGR